MRQRRDNDLCKLSFISDFSLRSTDGVASQLFQLELQGLQQQQALATHATTYALCCQRTLLLLLKVDFKPSIVAQQPARAFLLLFFFSLPYRTIPDKMSVSNNMQVLPAHSQNSSCPEWSVRFVEELFPPTKWPIENKKGR